MDGSIQNPNKVGRQDINMSDHILAVRIAEAILFASPEPMTAAALAERLPDNIDISLVLDDLSKLYEDRGVILQPVAGRWAFRTAPDLSGSLKIDVMVSRKLSRAAVETLAIIGYHQPITRGEIEEIRGVTLSKGTLDLLLEVGWIRPMGKRKTPGRPVTWGTSQKFLEHFNLNQVTDLPGVEELKAAGLLDRRPTRSIFGEIAVELEDKSSNSGNGLKENNNTLNSAIE